ncbi:DUF2935 domain-containing protein [Clostridium sp. MSJ-11]|uniref:DUF2935 domain-containing protein n=1 Tax=Clostridium mobile TaxID=2841512 RepID=A0ABS6EKP0_9CLOT|nr:DUF2935 domain-containing protein [Clostridium mobile]MBU5485783.1 DUF2935 domain-containing protein [Clostridium mobile]
MYCYTLVNNLNCVFNELILWSDISSEHPIFIKTLGELTKKDLPKDIVNQLMHINKVFSQLKTKVEELKKRGCPIPYAVMELKKLINEFCMHDAHFLSLLEEVKKYGKKDKVWQTLLEHITHEQKFMYELMGNINMQL